MIARCPFYQTNYCLFHNAVRRQKVNCDRSTYGELGETGAGVAVDLVHASAVVNTGSGQTLVQLSLTAPPKEPGSTGAVVAIDQILRGWVIVAGVMHS